MIRRRSYVLDYMYIFQQAPQLLLFNTTIRFDYTCTDYVASFRSIFPKSRDPNIRTLCSGIQTGANVKNPFLYASGLFKILEIVKKWKWGSELDTQLDKLPIQPSMAHILQAMKVVCESDQSLSLFRWARKQSWYSVDDKCYGILFDRLNQISDYDGMQTLLDEMILEIKHKFCSSFLSHNKVIHYLAKAEKLKPSFHYFEKMRELGCQIDACACNSLITMYLRKGLECEAFDVFKSMRKGGCDLDMLTYELMISRFAKSGKLNIALELFDEMKANGFKQSHVIFASLIELLLNTGKVEEAHKFWEEMKRMGIKPKIGLYNMIIDSHLNVRNLEIAASIFTDMEKAGFVPTRATYSRLINMHSLCGKLKSAMNFHHSMINAGYKPVRSACVSLLSLLTEKKRVGEAEEVLLKLKSLGFSIDVTASDILMTYIKDGSANVALRWLHFMVSSGIKPNSFIIMQLFKLCMKSGMFKSAHPVLNLYVNSSAHVDLIIYTSVLAHLVKCKETKNEGLIMSILRTTNHKAHSFLCGLFRGPEQRKQSVLSFVRGFFQSMDHETEEGPYRYFVNVLMNYLVIMGQMNRARCIWKVAYENKLYPNAIVFDQNVSWSVDVRRLSYGAALVAIVHSLHRFKKRMVCSDEIPRRIKLVTGLTLKTVVAEMMRSVGSPFELGKLVLRARGDHVFEWFNKPIVNEFLMNEFPSRTALLMYKLNVLFPCSTPEIRSLPNPKPPLFRKSP